MGRRNLSVILPAAGAGRRMRAVGPKSLIDVGGESLVARQVAVIREVHPRAEVILVVGHEADRVARVVRPLHVRVVENERHADTNVVRSIGMGIRAASHANLLVAYGDLLFGPEAIGQVAARGSAVVVDSAGRLDEETPGVTVQDGKAIHFSYGLPTKWGQIAFLTGREYELFRKFVTMRERRMCFGYEALNAVLSQDGVLRAVEPEGLRVVDIGTRKDVERARAMTCVS